MQDSRRLPRIERDEPLLVHEDENSHLWAVSYSDFLMALLSFFILFFSVDKDQRQNLLLNLAQDFQSKASATVGSGTAGGGSSVDDKNPSGARTPANLMHALSGLSVTVEKDQENLTVHFPDNFFLPGKHALSGAQETSVANLLKILKPYESKIKLYFEGHADGKLFKKSKYGASDNFVLSSLRASSALLVARRMGFSEKSLFIEGDSSNTRNSRTISVRIEPKGDL